ncbi:hypothetical protein [Vibrio jasicida]|uniref:hypothetical protein n=1 Tax=Vibrio jasicida TaxID=766224 RepID=UPI0007AF68E9|nr:hypothetical protein [Vibrio jasicida]
MLKFITHYFAKRRLAEHQQQTQNAIAAYEQEKAVVEFRLNEKQSELTDKLKQEVERQQSQLQNEIDQLNRICQTAVEMQPALAQLQHQMLAAVELWFQRQHLDQQRRTKNSEIALCNYEISYYQECIDSFNVASESQQYGQWRQLREQLALTIDSPHLDKANKQVEKWRKEQSEEVVRQRARITSAKHQAITLKQQLLTELQPIKAELNQVGELIREQRQLLRQAYFDASQLWRRIDQEVMNRPPSFTDLKAEGRALVQLKQELYDDKSEYSEQFQLYRTRVNQAHNLEEYDNLNHYKSQRSYYLNQMNEARERIDEVKEQQQQVRELTQQKVALKELIGQLHPNNRADRLFDLLHELMPDDDDKLYRQAIGISTRYNKPLLLTRGTRGGQYD